MQTPIYSAEQIRIPPELPEILKNYAKFIIKTRPEDILKASAEYFTRLSTQQRQMVDGKLNQEQLTTFYKKFQITKPVVSRKDIEDASQWADVGVSQLQDTLAYFDLTRLGDWTGDQISWMSFWAFLVASVAGNLRDTLLMVIDIAKESEKINLYLFRSVFEFLVSKDGQVAPHIVTGIKEALQVLEGEHADSDSLTEIVNDTFARDPPEPTEPDAVVQEELETPEAPEETAEEAPVEEDAEPVPEEEQS